MGEQTARFLASRSALLVVDMQNSFCSASGSFAQLGVDVSGCVAAIPGCELLAQGARAAGVPVIFVTYAYQPDYSDGGYLVREIHPQIVTVRGMLANTWDTEVVPELTPHEGDFAVIKSRYSAFSGTRLDSMLRTMGVTSIVVCGVTTNICVESTARDAAQLDYRVAVVRDATGEIDEERGIMSLVAIEHAFGRVLSVEQVCDEWKSRSWPDG